VIVNGASTRSHGSDGSRSTSGDASEIWRRDPQADDDGPDPLLSVDDLTVPEVLSQLFDLSESDLQTYLALLEAPQSTTGELTEVLPRDRSNVNRSMLELREKGLASREVRLLERGGYVYQYTATSLSEARAMMHEQLDAWTTTAHDRIDEFGADADDEPTVFDTADD
jgi:predicted transcriptional regulator